jgi:hypothetical protein
MKLISIIKRCFYVCIYIINIFSFRHYFNITLIIYKISIKYKKFKKNKKTYPDKILSLIHLDKYFLSNSMVEYVLNSMIFLIIHMSYHQQYVLENQLDDKYSELFPIFQEKQHKVFLDQAIDKKYDLFEFLRKYFNSFIRHIIKFVTTCFSYFNSISNIFSFKNTINAKCNIK